LKISRIKISFMNLLQIKVPGFSDGVYWNNVVQNAIGCAIGSVVAIGISILIYWLTIRATDKAARQALAVSETKQLSAFAMMLELAIEMATNQAKNLHEFVTNIRAHPSTFPIPAMHPLSRLKRITDTISIESTGLVYIKYFPKQEAAKEFTKILDHVDYLYAELNGLQDMIKLASLNHQDRLQRFAAIFDQTDKYIIDNLIIPNKTDDIAKRIRQQKDVFLKSRNSRDDAEPLYKFYFSPITEILASYLRAGGDDTTYAQLVYLTSKGIEYYGYIIAGYEKFEKELEGIIATASKNLAALREMSSPLLSSRFKIALNSID
jgi:hypothetical protein